MALYQSELVATHRLERKGVVFLVPVLVLVLSEAVLVIGIL